MNNMIDLEERTLQDYAEEIKKRRTFAIISHPDAGKTTLTEKLLLYGVGMGGYTERCGSGTLQKVRYLRCDVIF